MKSELTPLIQRMAWGDERDCGEMPIQSMAIGLLARLGDDCPSGHKQLRKIAENPETNEMASMEAWLALADLNEVE